jgi:hypothetical protein
VHWLDLSSIQSLAAVTLVAVVPGTSLNNPAPAVWLSSDGLIGQLRSSEIQKIFRSSLRTLKKNDFSKIGTRYDSHETSSTFELVEILKVEKHLVSYQRYSWAWYRTLNTTPSGTDGHFALHRQCHPRSDPPFPCVLKFQFDPCPSRLTTLNRFINRSR